MVGSQGSIPRNPLRRLLALVALLALVGVACGNAAEPQTTTAADASTSDVEYGTWGDDGDEDVAASVASPDDAESSEAGDGADREVDEDAPLGVAAGDASVPDVAPLAPEQTAQVLAYAIQASEELSYSFEQGMSMQMNMLGMNMDIAPADGFVSGEVSGSDSRVFVDLGVFMTSMLESMGMDLSNPAYAGVFGGFEDMTMEVWVVDSTMVIDMSGLAASIAGLDPTAADELAMFADGPVSVDLAALGALGDTDAQALVQQFGQGTQVTDPSALLEALRTIDVVTETGSDTVDGVPVTMYGARVSMAQYYDALGMDITDQLGAMEDFGIDADSAEADMLESMLPALEELTVDMTIMLDADGLVRRIETRMDMGEMMESMFAAEPEMAAIVGDIQVVVDTWQNFSDYGTAVTIAPPAAVDKTSELAGLIES